MVGCLALLCGSLALSAALSLSLTFSGHVVSQSYVSACAALKVIHPHQPHAQGEGRAGPGQDMLSRAG